MPENHSPGRNQFSPLMYSRDCTNEDDSSTFTPSANLLNSLQIRAQALLDELRAYQAHLQARNRQKEVEIGVFTRGVEAEVKSLEKLRLRFAEGNEADWAECEEDDESPQLHALRSSNLPFYETVWNVAKSCRGITALGKKVYRSAEDCPNHIEKPGDQVLTRPPSRRSHIRKKGVPVDIVAEDGLEWIKVSTVTEKRLLFEMAKEGWESYADFSDGSDIRPSNDAPADRCERITKLELVRVAEELKAASRAVRVQFQHPRIRLVLPKVREGALHDVDAFIAGLRATGATVQCGQGFVNTNKVQQEVCLEKVALNHEATVFYKNETVRMVKEVSYGQANRTFSTHESHALLGTQQRLDLDRLMPAVLTRQLTETLNVDCTILLALVSDISHLRGPRLTSDSNEPKGSYHKAILRQIDAEEVSPLLPKEIYPLLMGRELKCTFHAAQRMREIVQCMGTSSERTRADILFGEREYQGQPISVLRQALSEQSSYSVPYEIQFPIKVVDFDANQLLLSPARPESVPGAERIKAFPSSIAARVVSSMHLSPVNSSVFLYGWVERVATLTSNRTVARGLLRAINELLDQDERNGIQWFKDDEIFMGPQIYICETARSLIGKAKSKRER
ncbi:uncharacterized protein Z518_02927 [Rhinocladiella mackenziei CBS 650.93]|uniref:DUF1308 domain-containing protein n=1 Tax=Rhinocladiella mackenziei CBS 650.93 TaxID=1442369 RepID=A0A0D2IXZ3_9EURO|nr:uncharacterized protein Z518_02927 [Rhinocladiella mackenziei CBS 650.93]KIX08271.1 hypothetical protein Z518_02927 [Rhinocladiella mackenziei CBS 650.93]